MQTIHVNEVVVPEERQRTSIDSTELLDLQESIMKPIGLLQPIVLRNDRKTLVAGERRLRAITAIWESQGPIEPGKFLRGFVHNGELVPPYQIPYVTLSDIDPELIREAELEENVRRVDLSWQDRARAIAAIHQHLNSETFSDTAKEIYGENVSGRKKAEVAEAIRLAEFLDDPMVAAAGDTKTARKIIRETSKWKERHERLEGFVASSANHRLFLGDCFERARTDLDGVRLDVVVMDPPYGIDAHTKGFSFDGDLHEYDDSDAYFQAILKQLPGLCADITAEQAHIYCFCDIKRFGSLLSSFMLAGFEVWPRPIIWDKGTVGSFANIEYGPRACYDAILLANKGKKPFKAGYRDVISIAQETNAPHPAHKPRRLYSELVERSTLPGDSIADLFAGSGPIFAAAAEHSCIAYGWEINEKYYQMSLATIQEVTK